MNADRNHLVVALTDATPEQVRAALELPAPHGGVEEAKIEIAWHNGAPCFRLTWRERWGSGTTVTNALQDMLARTTSQSYR